MCISSYAQENVYLSDDDNANNSEQLSQEPSRFSYKFRSGVSMTSFDGNFLGTGFVAPEIGYKITDKFSLIGGFAASYSMLPSLYSEGNNNFMNYYFYAGGEYQLSPKISIRGCAALKLNSYSKPSFDGHFGIDYKISEHSTISLDVHIRKSNSPMPYSHGLMPPFSPFFVE